MNNTRTILSLFIISIIALIMSCKKETFDHSNETVTPPNECVCSDLGDSIEGIYEGRLLELHYISADPMNIICDTITDSILTINITRHWSGTFLDSLICEYNVPYLFDERIKLTDNSGWFSPSVFDLQLFSSASGNFKLLLWNHLYQNSYPGYNPIVFKYSGTKQ